MSTIQTAVRWISNKLLCLIVLGLTLFSLGCGLTPRVPDGKNQESSVKRVKISQQPVFYNQELFETALSATEGIKKEPQTVGAVVVPHHLLASKIIAQTLVRSSGRNIETVVIIGPNHDDKNPSTIGSAFLEWPTPLGSMVTEDSLVQKFLADLRLRPAPEAFTNEHSVGAIVPFVRHFFPEAKIVPIIFNSTASLQDTESVGRWLFDNLDEKSLVIVSTDFSHYLKEEAALRNDAVTEKLIFDYNLNTLMALGNDFLDSPPSLVSALVFAKRKRLNPSVIYHANTNDFSENTAAEITSYFGIVFY